MKSVPLLLALAAVALGAPSPTRTPRQAPAPGADILTTISEAFQQHVMQKMQRVTDVLGSLGVRVPVPNLSDTLPTGIVNMAQDIAAEEEPEEP